MGRRLTCPAIPLDNPHEMWRSPLRTAWALSFCTGFGVRGLGFRASGLGLGGIRSIRECVIYIIIYTYTYGDYPY